MAIVTGYTPARVTVRAGTVTVMVASPAITDPNGTLWRGATRPVLTSASARVASASRAGRSTVGNERWTETTTVESRGTLSTLMTAVQA